MKTVKRRMHHLGEIKNVLIIQLGDIGDIVWTIPTLRAVRETIPAARVGILLRQGFGSLLEEDPSVDKIFETAGQVPGILRGWITGHRPGSSGNFGHGGSTWLSICVPETGARSWPCSPAPPGGCRSSTRGRYSVLAKSSLHGGGPPSGRACGAWGRRTIVAYRQGAGHRYCQRSPHARGFRTRSGPEPAHSLHGGNRGWGPMAERQSVLQVGLQGIARKKMGGSAPMAHRQPLRFSRACRGARRAAEGGALDPRADRKLRRKKIVNLVGKTSLSELSGVLSLSRLHVGVDSAAPHIAAAVGTPTITVYGPTSWRDWAPIGEDHRVIASDLDCVPCRRKGCNGSEKSRCLEELDIEIIKKAIDEKLARAGKGP